MTTLKQRPDTALLVIDVQNDVMAGAFDREGVIARILRVVERARAAGTAVVWIQHSDDGLAVDSPGWQYVPELVPAAGEALVHKSYGDSFEDTDLEDVLSRLGVGHLVVTGAQSDACIRCTLHGAIVRGYDTTLVTDAHSTEDLSQWGAPPPEQVTAHTNLYWHHTSAPGRRTLALTADEVTF